MNARWIFSLAAGTAVLLCGALLATAAAPNIGQNRSPMQGSAKSIQDSALIGVTVLDSQGQKLGQIKEVLVDSRTGKATFLVLDAVATGSGHPVTYTAARPIDNPSVPSTPSQPMPAPCVVPPPCVNSTDSGWTQDLEDLYNE